MLRIKDSDEVGKVQNSTKLTEEEEEDQDEATY